MMRLFSTAGILAVVVVLLLPVRGVVPPERDPQVWFAPVPGGLDMLRLFENEDEWTDARSRIDVFKFYGGHARRNAPADIFGPNTYDALVRVRAFAKLGSWNKKIAIEVAAVKPPFCAAGDAGMRSAVAETVEAVTAVEQAGGRVDYLAMDEPLLSGTFTECGGSDPEPTYARIERYVQDVRRFRPAIQVGLIEPYPFFSAATIVRHLDALARRGVAPPFFHLDVDLDAVPKGKDPGPDLLQIAAFAESHGIAFGVIVCGNNGTADALYVESAIRLVEVIRRAFGPWEDLPSQLVFQSWAESPTGLRVTPANLPESRRDTHTYLINLGLARLRLTAPRDVKRQPRPRS